MTSLRLFLSSAAILALAGVLIPSAALAQASSDQVITTAQPGAAPPPVQPVSTQVARTRPDRNYLSQQEPLPDHKVHGEVSVGVGSNGYREVAADVDAPIGDNGEVDVAIDSETMSGRRR
jgi:hypothetical protein